MSRASLAVVSERSSAPPLRAQASAMRRARATLASMFPSGAGQACRWASSRSSSAGPQSARVLSPTPRGSKLTRSYAPPVAVRSCSPFLASFSLPELPGPPGTTSRVPRLRSGWSLRRRETATVTRGPLGSR